MLRADLRALWFGTQEASSALHVLWHLLEPQVSCRVDRQAAYEFVAAARGLVCYASLCPESRVDVMKPRACRGHSYELARDVLEKKGAANEQCKFCALCLDIARSGEIRVSVEIE